MMSQSVQQTLFKHGIKIKGADGIQNKNQMMMDLNAMTIDLF